MKKEREKGRGYLTGVVAVVFMIIGYQTALFIHHAAVMKITADRDAPDTVYVYQNMEGLSDGYSGRNSERTTSAFASDEKAREKEGRYLREKAPASVRKNIIHSKRAQVIRDNLPPKQVESFRFNPNTVSEEELCRLGFTPRQARSILSYRDKGGRFRRKTDFAASFVVSDSIYRRLEPYIDIPLIDLNLADSAAFDSLPGIGGWFASKMVEYRKELGGYSCKEQLMEIWKFDREKYDALADLITIDSAYIQPYPLWSLPADSLRLHPYIRNYETARAIVLFRENTPPDSCTVQLLARAGIINHETSSRLSRCAIRPAKN